MKNNLTYNLKAKIHLIAFMLICTTFTFCKRPINRSEHSSQDSWELRDSIVNSIKIPTFPARFFNILDYGAKGDGVSFEQNTFNLAIKKCTEAGGGRVIVPRGQFLTGPIHLEDNVNLHLEEGSEILFTPNLDRFPIVLTSYEGTECKNFSPLIYAYKKKNIAITGSGVLNGQASNEHWWNWCGKVDFGWKEGSPKQHSSLKKLKTDMSEKNVPVNDRVFGIGEYLRPSFIEPYECSNILIEGVTIINAPFWVIHPYKSNNIIIDGVTVDSHGPNNDGCDPEYSKNIWFKNCTFNTGDDCIAIKAGRNEDGRRVGIKTENVIIEGCKMIDGHGGVVIGSEMSAGVRNVFVQDCHMSSPNLDRAIRIKTNTKRGGIVENLYVRNLYVGEVKEAFLKINLFYGTYANQEGDFMPHVRNINLNNIQVENGGKYGILINGYEESSVRDIVLQDVRIIKVDQPYSIKGAKNVSFINTSINGKIINKYTD